MKPLLITNVIYRFTKRLSDILIAMLLLIAMCVPMMVIAISIRLTSPGRVLYWSTRIGKDNKLFQMPKFRTMKVETPAVATHLLLNPNAYLTTVGRFLRKTSLDELPQVWSILKGDMSFVGPRPALFNQYDLIALRTLHQVDNLLPGLTGWAQINGRDELSSQEKVSFDVEYGRRRSLMFDFNILWLTVLKVIRREGVSH